MAQIEFNSPGVYGIEKTPASAPDSLAPAVAGFIGWTEEGPSNTPVKVRSIEQFDNRFGPITTLGVIPLEMRGFFGVGGSEAWIVRVVPSDAVNADVDIDTGPVKWTFTSNGEGLWGNDTTVLVRGNRNFINRTTGEWDKFDVLVLRPSDFDATIDIAAEVYEAVQFTDSTAGDYVLTAIQDERAPSQYVVLTQVAGGTPAALLGTSVTDEFLGSGTGALSNFTGTLAAPPLLDNTLVIVAPDAQVSDEAQTPTVGTVNSSDTAFEFTLVSGDALDGSVRLFFAKAPAIAAEAPVVTGAIDDVNTTYSIAAGALSDSVHREGTVFALNYTGATTNPTLHTDGGGGAAHDLSTTPIVIGGPIVPGTLTLSVDIGAGPVIQTDDGLGAFPITAELPAGPVTINYTTGAMVGSTAALLASSSIISVHGEAKTITKAAGTDNLELGVVLGGDGSGTIDLVDSVVTPTGNGALAITTAQPARAGTTFTIDFVASGIVDSDLAGALTGDVGVGTNTVDFLTGDVDVELSVAALTGTTIDATYQSGQIVTDNGLGALVGDVDPSATNTINYDTGVFDVTFASPPLSGTNNILASYRSLPKEQSYPLTGGLNGTAIGRSDISDPVLLEDARLGIYALDSIEEPINVVVPDFEGVLAVQDDLVDFALARNQGPGTRFAILGAATGTTVDEAIKYVQVDQAWDSRAAAYYYPNVKFVNESNNSVEIIPVTGFVAGVYAKTASNKNVGKSPGGIEDGAMDAPGTVGPEFELTLADRDKLYQSRINPVYRSTATGYVVWGVRSLSKEIRWRYVNARLLHNFLMHRLFLLLQFAVFENNGPALWLRIEQAVKGFMDSLFRLGFFAGDTAADAFFVKANSSNNNAQTINEGKVLIDIGFSPNKPAEFVIFKLQQPAGTSTV